MAAQSVTDWLDAQQNNDMFRYQLVEAVRQLILQVGPSIAEEIKYGGILFAADKAFCGVFSYANHISLEFSEGAVLPDPFEVLEGKGKGRRHIKLGAIDDIVAKHVEHYVAAAYAAAQARL